MNRSFKQRIAAVLLILALFLGGCELVPLRRSDIPEAIPLTPDPPVEDAASEPETVPHTGHSTVRVGGADPDPASDRVYPDFPSSVLLLSGQAFVYDVEQGGIVAMKGKDDLLYPASVTKLLTILTALQYLSPDQLVVPGDELSLVEWDSTVAYISAGHIVSVEALVEGMLLPSGGDAAYVLSAAAGRKIAGEDPYCAASGGLTGPEAVELFVCAMNDYADSIFMRHSHFVTPDGYFDQNHYSSISDMTRLTIAAYDCELIRRYCGVLTDSVTYASGQSIRWENTNKMLDPDSGWYSPYVKGMKTGSITNANSLVAIFEKDGKTYLVGVFSAPDDDSRYQDMTAILNWLFK